jgi:phenylalanyl-tRNA synthetase alpha subunit
LLRRDVSDATSGRNFFRIDGEVMNKDCSWQYMVDNP